MSRNRLRPGSLRMAGGRAPATRARGSNLGRFFYISSIVEREPTYPWRRYDALGLIAPRDEWRSLLHGSDAPSPAGTGDSKRSSSPSSRPERGCRRSDGWSDPRPQARGSDFSRTRSLSTKLDAATIGAVVAFQADAREPFGESHWSVNRVVSVAHPPTKLPSSHPATRGRPAGPLVGGQKVGVAQAPGEGLEQLAHHRGDFSHQLEQVGSVQLQHLEIAGRCHRGRAWLAVDQG